MAIKVNNKKKELSLPKGMDLFFHFNIMLFLLAGCFYLFVYYLNDRAGKVETEIIEFTDARKAEFPEKQELETLAQEYNSLIEDFKLVVTNRNNSSLFFGPFEKMIHPKISIVSATNNLEEGTASLQGSGENLVVVGQQFQNLKNNDFITSVSLSDLSIVEESQEREGIDFSFSLDFNKEFLKSEIE